MKSRQPKYRDAEQREAHPLLLDCPSCHSFISEENIHKEKSIATCGYCDHVFQLDDDTYWDPFGPAMANQPAGIEVLRLKSMLSIQVKHASSKDKAELAFMGFFALMWNAALGAFIWNAASSGIWVVLLFASIHLIAGITMLWNFLSGVFNNTTIDVTERAIVIKTKPFSLPGRRELHIPSHEVKQLFVKSTKRKSQGSGFGLYLQMRDGKKKLLVAGLDRSTLTYLEREVEQQLGIKDRPVR